MKLALALLSFCLSTSALACDPRAALVGYYGGPEVKDLRISETSNGAYSLSWTDTDQGGFCRGALARVNGSCQVEVVRQAFCENN